MSFSQVPFPDTSCRASNQVKIAFQLDADSSYCFVFSNQWHNKDSQNKQKMCMSFIAGRLFL